MGLSASVIVRSKDKVSTIEATLRSVREQTVRAELVVVDSGSTDGTLEVAHRLADRVELIAPEDFTYGGALNVGARAASGDVHFALSAHSVPYSGCWVERSLARYARADVAGTNSGRRTPDGRDIVGVHHQSARDAVEHGWWGFSNHGGSWRASVWQDEPFREDLPASEDKEWSWRVLARGWTIAYAPDLGVSSTHRRQAGLRALFRRVRKERSAMLALGAVEPRSLAGSVHAWWNPPTFPEHRPLAVRRCSPWRLVEHAAEYLSDRDPPPPVPNPALTELRRQVADGPRPGRRAVSDAAGPAGRPAPRRPGAG
ncbi:glycosyltransferase [Jannaschia sp. R86511]|uniref:glycosyltransferase n=1 Tax=Jannaschia sp. R86511 TaxID=3093853 RepID=UPI0036D34074